MVAELITLLFLSSAIARSDFLIPKIIAFALFALISSQTAFKKSQSIFSKITFFSLFLLIIYKTFNISWLAIAFSFITFLFITLILKKRLINYKKLTNVTLAAIILSFLSISWLESKTIRYEYLVKPQEEEYVSDNLLYLRTFYYLKKGYKYHSTFAQSYFYDARSESLPSDLWGFRLPTTFFLWKLAAGKTATDIYYFFLINCCTILILSFFIAKRFTSKNSLIAPYLLMPYLLFGTTSLEFLQIEWWGLLPMFIFVWAVITSKKFLTFVASFWAMATRELFLIPLGFIGIISLFFKKPKIARSLFFAFVLFLFFLFLHACEVFKIIPFNKETIFSGRTHGHGLEMCRQALVFGSWRYLFSPMKLFTIYLLIALTGKFYLFIKLPKMRFKLALLTGLYLPTLISFLRIGHCCWSDYWGVVLNPFLILSAVITINLLIKFKTTCVKN